nr:uncharacterized protein LOC128682840 isoform X3 [Plodia interpunctella]XP_053623987.1 uncharacterized protein LOC128682940 isoform X3 [Plodia interpunctella]
MSETDSDRCETMESNMTTMASASSMAANVKALQRKRAALTKHYNYFNDIENVDRDREALLIREERLRATFEKFDEINLEICATDPKAGDSGDVESKFLEVITLIKKLMVNSATRPSAQPPSRHKLPQISVPTFTDNRALALENAERQVHPSTSPKVVHTVTMMKKPSSPQVCILCAATA